MASTNLDLPVLMSADQIRRREFVVIRRGYDPRQVRDFLDDSARALEQMESMLQEARLEADAALRAASVPRADPYSQLAGRVAGVLRAADEEAETTRRDAREEAERILREARSDADRIGFDAQARAEETTAEAEHALRAAREQADRTIAGLATKRDAVVDQLAAMQEKLMGVARELESTITLPEATALSEPVAASRDASARPWPWAAPSTDAPSDPDDASKPSDAPERVGASDPDRSGSSSDRTIVLGEAGGTDALAPPPGENPSSGGQMELLDPLFEELWEGTETIELEIPDIPALDLDWDDLETGEDADPTD